MNSGKVVKVLRKGKWKPNNSSPRANTSRAKAAGGGAAHRGEPVSRRVPLGVGVRTTTVPSGRSEVTTGNGREFDVYVNSRGRSSRLSATAGPRSPSSHRRLPVVRRQMAVGESAKQIAVAHMQREFGMGARVTWSGREDDSVPSGRSRSRWPTGVSSMCT